MAIARGRGTTSRSSRSLYRHATHPHTPQNPNALHKAEQRARIKGGGVGGFNERLAVWVTRYVGTMWTAYGFSALALCGLLGVLAILNPSVYTFIAWLSQTFIQLVLLPIIMVGQNVNSRHSELMAEQMFHNTVRLLHELLQIVKHLNAQDSELLEHRALLQRHGALLQELRDRVDIAVTATSDSHAGPDGVVTPSTPHA